MPMRPGGTECALSFYWFIYRTYLTVLMAKSMKSKDSGSWKNRVIHRVVTSGIDRLDWRRAGWSVGRLILFAAVVGGGLLLMVLAGQAVEWAAWHGFIKPKIYGEVEAVAGKLCGRAMHFGHADVSSRLPGRWLCLQAASRQVFEVAHASSRGDNGVLGVGGAAPRRAPLPYRDGPFLHPSRGSRSNVASGHLVCILDHCRNAGGAFTCPTARCSGVYGQGGRLYE